MNSIQFYWKYIIFVCQLETIKAGSPIAKATSQSEENLLQANLYNEGKCYWLNSNPKVKSGNLFSSSIIIFKMMLLEMEKKINRAIKNFWRVLWQSQLARTLSRQTARLQKSQGKRRQELWQGTVLCNIISYRVEIMSEDVGKTLKCLGWVRSCLLTSRICPTISGSASHSTIHSVSPSVYLIILVSVRQSDSHSVCPSVCLSFGLSIC